MTKQTAGRLSGPLIDLISDLREAIHAGEDDLALAHRLLPGLALLQERREAAAALGRLGGRARAEKLSPARRVEIARRAAEARWAQRALVD